MVLKFDATVKAMLEEGPADWPALAGRKVGPVEDIDADVSTVSAATDKVLRVRATPNLDHAFRLPGRPGRLPAAAHARV
jgi:hypothetical protein